MNMGDLKRWGIVFVFAAAMVLGVGCGPYEAAPAGVESYAAITEEGIAADIARLADPANGGRMTGTRGNAIAAEYIAERMTAMGLGPAGDDGTYFQDFWMPGVSVAGEKTFLSINEQRLTRGDQFDTMVAGLTGEFEGPLVFAGYGLQDEDYDDYAGVGVGVDGAVVMILLGSPWDDEWDHRSEIVAKLRLAKRRGARAALVVAPSDLSEHDPLEDVWSRADRAPIRALRLSRAVADELIARTDRFESVDAVAEAIRQSGQSQSFAIEVTVKGKVHFAGGRGRNVIGRLDATDPYKFVPTILLTAHYDHLDVWGDDRAEDVGFGVRPGADDNASGTAALLAVAEALARVPQRRCHYVIMATSGEEYGFVGAIHFADNSLGDVDAWAINVNIDQIGSVTGDGVNVIGDVLDWDISGMLSDANRDVGMTVWSWALKGVYWSDDAVFADEGMKTLFFHGGLNPDTYHMTTDHVETVNLRGIQRVALLVFETVRRLDAYYRDEPAYGVTEPAAAEAVAP